MVTSTIPTWQSECAKAHMRGFLITLSGCLISFGIMVSYWVDYEFFFLEGSVRWRFPIVVSRYLAVSRQLSELWLILCTQFQSFFTLIVMWMLLYLPESPRWLAMRGRMDEAREVTSRLLDLPIDDPEVIVEIKNISDALEVQSRGGGFKYRELLTNGPSQNFRRTALGVTAQFFQQVCYRCPARSFNSSTGN
jgi:hypothetical protein